MKKIIAAIIAVILLCAVPTGCAKQKQGTSDEVVQVYSFEKTIKPVCMHKQFGALNLNDDPEYVSEGKQSLKISPSCTIADYNYIYLPFLSEYLGFDYTDASKVKRVTADIYAESAAVIKMGMYFSEQAELKGEANVFNLKAGWNEVSFELRHAIIAIQYDITECYGVYLICDTAMSDQGVSIYLDDLSIVRGDIEEEAELGIFLDSTADYFELADFEHAYQQMLVTSETQLGGAPLASVSVVKTADYGITAPSGERALRIVTFPKSEGVTNPSTWTQIFFSDKWLQVLNPKRFTDLDKYHLKLSIYQQDDVKIGFEFNFYTLSGGMSWDQVVTKKGEWVEYDAPLSKFTAFFDDPGRFGFAWLDWDAKYGDSAVFYLDNVRIERVG